MRLHIPSLSTALFALMASVTVAAVVSGQSLADVARKEEERRKAAKDAPKVYSDKDVGHAQAAPALPAPSQTEANKPAASAETSNAGTEADGEKPQQAPGEKPPTRDQAYWSGRMKELQTQVERDQTYADALQTRINSLSADFVNRDDPAQRAVIEQDRQKAVAELERLKKAIEDGRKAIAGLEEDARRAGVPPGWLR